MPAADARAFGFKYVNGHPGNQAAGLQTVTGFGVLADVATGYPYLIAEMTLMTAMRTAAMSVLAARHLPRPEARSMAPDGGGAQSEFPAGAFLAPVGDEEHVVEDVDHRKTGARGRDEYVRT